MGQSANYAAVTGAQLKSTAEECAGDMGLGGGGDESTTTPW